MGTNFKGALLTHLSRTPNLSHDHVAWSSQQQNDRSWVASCSYGSLALNALGVGHSKKAAAHEAAGKMLGLLKEKGNVGGGGGGGGGEGKKRKMSTTAEANTKKAKSAVNSAPKAKATKANPLSRTSSTTLSSITKQRFSDLQMCAELKKAVTKILGYEFMTKVQADTIPVSLTGVDILAKAKTGTGKTLAFLLPALERAFRSNRNTSGVSILILSPTRELAQQIADEANQLKTFTNMQVQCVVGGVKIDKDLRKLNKSIPDVLIATPGRLHDHLQNHGLAQLMGGSLSSLIFDEADRLLDMGFRPEIEKILRLLPKTERQTSLFSATMPKDLKDIVRLALNKQYKHIDCVGEEVDTHRHVQQSYSVHPFNEQYAELLLVLEKSKQDNPDYKIIVFFATARQTQIAAEVFNKIGVKVFEIHSRKSQSQRTKISAQFRDSKKSILFTSDVTARGLDYPDVSMVVQVGLPADKAQYTHRLGRTARAGKGGCGVLLLAEFEKAFLRELADQDLIQLPTTSPDKLASSQARVDRAFVDGSLTDTVNKAYQAQLGFYKGNLKRLGLKVPTLVQVVNDWSTGLCKLSEPPAILAKTIGKMGLRGVAGIRVEGGNNHSYNGRNGRNGGGRSWGR